MEHNNLNKFLDIKKTVSYGQYSKTLLGSKVLSLMNDLNISVEQQKDICNSKSKNDVIGLILSQVDLKANAIESFNNDLISEIEKTE